MRRLILVLALVAAACASPGSEPTALESSTTTTSITASTTTTTTIPSPNSIPIGDTTRFTPGVAYTGALAIVDLEYRLEFRLDGWRVLDRGIGEGRYIRLTNKTTSPGADLLLMAWKPESGSDAIMSDFLDHPNLADSTAAQSATVSELPAQVADIRVSEASAGTLTDDPCWGQMTVVADTSSRLARSPGAVQPSHVWACTWGRVWTIDVDGVTITVVGTADEDSLDPENSPQIEDFEPLLDDFINAITFCTEATSCDD